MDPSEHDERIAESFGKQAATFEDERLNMAFTSGLPWLVEHIAPVAGEQILEVAAGTALVGRALADAGSEVVALDRTVAMLEEGRRHTTGRAPQLLVGTAERLPFPDDRFDAVVTRFSLHHLVEPLGVLAEMSRVCRPDGRLVVKDLVADTDPAVAERQDRVESWRDPSHLRMPPRGAVAGWLADLGHQATQVSVREIERPLEPWLEQSVTAEDGATLVRQAMEAELAGGEVTGMRPRRRDGELWFGQTWEITVAR
ncbi:MAG: class I SAM-dependent methyltransferase [Nocardioidaceae bacterium]